MTKQQILDAIEKLPDDATFDDAIERLQFLQELEGRAKRADVGHTISTEEARARFDKWLKSSG